MNNIKNKNKTMQIYTQKKKEKKKMKIKIKQSAMNLHEERKNEGDSVSGKAGREEIQLLFNIRDKKRKKNSKTMTIIKRLFMASAIFAYSSSLNSFPSSPTHHRTSLICISALPIPSIHIENLIHILNVKRVALFVVLRIRGEAKFITIRSKTSILIANST
jgi:hypothetical protein